MATINGTADDEALIGGLEDDLIRGKGGNDLVQGYPINGGHGEDDGQDTLLGGGRHDDIRGGTNRDWLEGGGGRDTLFGGEGSDRLHGDGKDDSLYGGRGTDRLFGGEGADTLRGNEGRDRFTYSAVEDSNLVSDTITDFTQGEDWIKFTGEALGPGGTLTFIGTQAFSATGGGEIRYSRVDRTMIDVDVNGDGALDMRIFLANPLDLTAADFIIG